MSSVTDTHPTFPSPDPRLSWVGILVVLVLIMVLAGAAYGGYQAGLTQHAEDMQATQTAEITLQYTLGLADMTAGRYEVAVARFNYILSLDPHYPGAAQHLTEAQQALSATPTPTSSPTLAPTPSPTANNAGELFSRLQEAATQDHWDDMINNALALRALDPNYEATQVGAWLFTALRNRGVARIVAKELEGGIFDLDQAADLAPLDAEALSYRNWARLYLAAQSYWGLDWRLAVINLEQLYLIAPYFHDTGIKLYQAYVNYAAHLKASGDSCSAAQYYAASQIIATDPTIVAAQATAQAICSGPPAPEASATLTPTTEASVAPPTNTPTSTPEMTPLP